MTKAKKNLIKLVLSAMFIALCYVLPFLTANSQELGNALCLMHIPVLLCGFICGPAYGGAVGAIAPIMRGMLAGKPILLPFGLGMAFELAAYGIFAGLFYKYLPKKKVFYYLSLVSAMLIGRVVWGLARYLMIVIARWMSEISEGTKSVADKILSKGFGWEVFFADGFVKALPGIALQIVFVPLVIIALEKPIKRLK